MRFDIPAPILWKVADYFAIDRVEVTWQKILIPILIFVIVLFIFIVVQVVLQIVSKLFRMTRGQK